MLYVLFLEALENAAVISDDEMEVDGMVGGPLKSDLKQMSDDDVSDVSLGSGF